jgi:choline dehydrogenase
MSECGFAVSSSWRKSLHLTGSDPDNPAKIDANYLDDPEDLKDLIAGLSRAREIGNSAPLRPFRGAR